MTSYPPQSNEVSGAGRPSPEKQRASIPANVSGQPPAAFKDPAKQFIQSILFRPERWGINE